MLLRDLGLFLLILAPCLYAQDYRARVQGIVTDTSQGVVPGAQVVLHNNQTGVSVSRETSATGRYFSTWSIPASIA